LRTLSDFWRLTTSLVVSHRFIFGYLKEQWSPIKEKKLIHFHMRAAEKNQHENVLMEHIL
jgi:hypothetical protein